MYYGRFSENSQNLLWPYALMFVTWVSNRLPRRRFKETPHDLWFGKDALPCRFLKYLQHFGRVAHIARHSSTRTKMSPK